MPSIDILTRFPGEMLRTTWIQDKPPVFNEDSGSWIPGSGHYAEEHLATDRGYEYKVRSSTTSRKVGNKYIRSLPYYYYESNATDWHGSGAYGYEPTYPWEVRRCVSSSGSGFGGPFPMPQRYGWDTVVVANFDELQARAGNSLLSKISSQDVNLGNAIGERRQTYDLITSAAKAVVKGLRDLRSGKLAANVITGMFERANYVAGWVPPSSMPRRERRHRSKVAQKRREEGIARAKADLRTTAQSALVFDYGVKPLLDDIHGAAENFRRRFLEGQQELISARVSSKDQASSAFVFHDSALHVEGNGFVSRSVRMGIKYRVTNPLLRDLQQLGLVNPLSIAWEVTPWSFVADWFCGVGQFIELQSATAGCTFVDGYLSTREEKQGTCTAHRAASVGTNYDYKSLSCANRIVEVRRSPLSGFPVPSLNRGKGIHSETRAREAVSLAITNLRFFK